MHPPADRRSTWISKIGILAGLATLLCSGAIFLSGTAARADTVTLTGGALLKGRIVEERRDANPPILIIELEDDFRIAVPLSRVSKKELDKGFAEYAARAAAAGDDPEMHYELAKACMSEGLVEQRNYHMRRTIALNPDHSKARAALNYVEASNGSGWIKFSEQQRNHGLLLRGSTSVLPEAYARDEQRDKNRVAEQVWKKKLTKLRATALSSSKRAGEALQEIMAIDDPLATAAIADELENSRGTNTQPREMRLIWMKKLASFKNVVAVRALVLAGIAEPTVEMREEALRALLEYGRSSAVATYIARLDPKKYKNPEIKLALRALLFFPDPELWREYVDALVTKHETRVQIGGGTGATFSDRGGGGMSSGSAEKVRTDFFKNQDALLLLKEIAPGVDYGYNQQAWREHFATLLTRAPGSIRRDP